MKTALFLLVLAVLPCLVGAKFYDVEFKGADRPFVDLGVLLKEGGNYLPDEMKIIAEEHKKTDTPDQDSLMIRVRNTTVFLNEEPTVGKPYTSLIGEVYKEGMSVTVSDDYAEYRTFEKLLGFLGEQGIDYSTETLE